jgi:hypothetical protein
MALEPIECLAALLSLDVTAGLVAQGMRAPWTAGANVGDAAITTLAVTGASNTSPIVITVASGDLGVIAPREGRVLHVVVAGVLGNTAANKLDTVNLRNEAWAAVVTSPTTLALYDLDSSTGEMVASVGNGAYTGGGTVSKAFIDGQILLGQEYVGELSAGPRVIFIPKRCTYGGRDEASSLTTSAIADGETEAEELSPAIRTRTIFFNVGCWAKGSTSTASFGAVDRVADQIVRSANERTSGVFELGAGEYIDQAPDAPQLLRYGHGYGFELGIAIPIRRVAVEYAPDDTALDANISMQADGGEPEQED